MICLFTVDRERESKGIDVCVEEIWFVCICLFTGSFYNRWEM